MLDDPRKVASPTRKSKISEFLNIKRVEKTLHGYDWFMPLMNKALERGQSFWEDPRTYFRASSAGEECIRALTFELAGHRVPFEARTLRIFSTGNSIEDTVVDAMRKANVFVDEQIKLKYDDPPIRGKADVIIRNPTTNQKYLGEIKSINQNAFTKLEDNATPIMAGESKLLDTQRKYVVQWNLYAWADSIDLDTGFLLFEAKNTQEEKVVWLQRDKSLLEDTKKRLTKALSYGGDIAPRTKEFDPKKPRSKCGWCPRKYLCKKMTMKKYTYDKVRALDKSLRGDR